MLRHVFNDKVGSFCRFLPTRRYAIKFTLLLVSRCFQFEKRTQRDAQTISFSFLRQVSTKHFELSKPRLSMTSVSLIN